MPDLALLVKLSSLSQGCFCEEKREPVMFQRPKGDVVFLEAQKS